MRNTYDITKISCGTYHKDDELNADCGKENATKGDSWEWTLEIH